MPEDAKGTIVPFEIFKGINKSNYIKLYLFLLSFFWWKHIWVCKGIYKIYYYNENNNHNEHVEKLDKIAIITIIGILARNSWTEKPENAGS